MSIRMDDIKDPRLRARIEYALGAGGGSERPAGCADGKLDTRTVWATASRPPVRCCSTHPARPSRIRQSSKPVLNGLETKALAWLQSIYPSANFHAQAWRVKLANGAWYKVDLCAFLETHWHGWEVKELRGKSATRGILALKCAAHQFPEVRWHLIWRKKGQPWQDQEVLP